MTTYHKLKGSKGKGHIYTRCIDYVNLGFAVCGMKIGLVHMESLITTENLCKRCLKWEKRNGEDN